MGTAYTTPMGRAMIGRNWQDARRHRSHVLVQSSTQHIALNRWHLVEKTSHTPSPDRQRTTRD